MKRGLTIALLLALLLGLYLVGSALMIDRVSEREENWHEQAVRKTRVGSQEDYLRLRNRPPALEWDDFTAGGKRYRLWIFEDRSFLFAAFRKGTPSRGMPDYYDSGRVAAGAWARLRDALAVPELADLPVPEGAEVKITVSGQLPGGRAVYGYRKADWPALPAVLRTLDAEILALARTAWTQPDRAYTVALEPLSYGPDALPRLLQGLAGDQEATWPVLARRITALGPEGAEALGERLLAGADDGYRPAARYAAILEALAESFDGSRAAAIVPPVGPSRERATIRLALERLAASAGGPPGKQRLAGRAREVLGTLDRKAFRHERFAVPAELALAFGATPPDALRAEFERLRLRLTHRSAARQEEAFAGLVALGEPALPLLLEALRALRFEHHHFDDRLARVLLEIAGPAGLLHLVELGVLDAAACIPLLDEAGEEAVPALLALLDSDGRHGHRLIVEALSAPHHRARLAQFQALRDERLRLAEEEPSPALRALHQATAENLGRIIDSYQPPGRSMNPRSIDRP